jgi:phosphotransferase system HPr (HPr) family protein
MIVKAAGKYKADLKIKNQQNMTVDGKSMLELMQLAAMYGDEVELIADGQDEKELLNEITKLFEDKFGED